MRYIEIGLGNRWFIRTETEFEDGTEIEQQGILKPILFRSLYIRIWLNKTCLVLNSKEGVKRMNKKRRAFKFVLGIVSETPK
ncbi:DUF3977 family protein [Ectobacillus ponti]|uniref:DUF3977 family protein n=1 Tax=Ectobacillus ponti TaxID=2961894 RepID=A0AA41X8W3_9BACI|nr:DUF3977 family protein [Ectobacillus ponti]